MHKHEKIDIPVIDSFIDYSGDSIPPVPEQRVPVSGLLKSDTDMTKVNYFFFRSDPPFSSILCA